MEFGLLGPLEVLCRGIALPALPGKQRAKGRPAFSAPPPQMWDSAPLPAGTRTVTGPGGQVLAARSGLPAHASPSGPGVASQVRRVPVTVTRRAIILSPARTALTGPRTTYPV
jgi:hypothetical protein